MFFPIDHFRNRAGISVLLLSMIWLGACSRASKPSTSTPEHAPALDQAITQPVTLAVTKDVHAFADTVAADVTKRGIIAWQDRFSETSSFFMAADGRLVFVNRDDATKQIPEIAAQTSRIELKWGVPMLIDPISADLAMVAAPYHEVIVDTNGQTDEENGYFTGLAERRPAGWKFRNAHWSTTPPPDKQPSK